MCRTFIATNVFYNEAMKIVVTWNKPDGTRPTVGFDANENDPYNDDEEMQVHKAAAAAQIHFRQKFGESPAPDQISYQVAK